MEWLLKSMINVNFLYNFIAFLLYSATISNDEEDSNDQSFFRKFRAKKKEKKPAAAVSLASLVRNDYSLCNHILSQYISVSICRTTRCILDINWYFRWSSSWCSSAINDSCFWRSS